MIEELRRALHNFYDTAPAHRRLEISDEGVSLISGKSGRELWWILWANIDKIIAFKVDAMVVDHICLGFVSNGESVFRIADEETPGWTELVAEIANRFEAPFEEWFARVAFPAFAENCTVIWSRSEGRLRYPDA